MWDCKCSYLKEETNRLLKAIEEANKKMQITETSIQEKDQRIGELDRLIERMEEVWELVDLIAVFKGNAEAHGGNWIRFLVFFRIVLFSFKLFLSLAKYSLPNCSWEQVFGNLLFRKAEFKALKAEMLWDIYLLWHWHHSCKTSHSSICMSSFYFCSSFCMASFVKWHFLFGFCCHSPHWKRRLLFSP